MVSRVIVPASGFSGCAFAGAKRPVWAVVALPNADDADTPGSPMCSKRQLLPLRHVPCL